MGCLSIEKISMGLMPILGASIHIVQKFLFECTSIGADGQQKKFQKPYFFTWLGSFGMFVMFIVNLCTNFTNFKAKYLSNKKFIKPFLYLFISTLFNLTAGTLSNISSLYLNYSVSLMLRSSTLLFGALISCFYLKKPLKGYQNCGVFLTFVAIIFVSLAATFSSSSTAHKETTSLIVFLFIIVRIASKSIQAISMIIEEKVMKSSGMTPFELTGLSGIWSIILSSLLLPLEGVTDTFVMIKNSPRTLILSILSFVIFGTWNILALNISAKQSAVTRMVFEQLTIVVVWVVQISIFYGVKGTSLEESYAKTGEAWTSWSWLQLAGFVIMVYGACVYQHVVRAPCSIGESGSESHGSLLEEEEEHILDSSTKDPSNIL